MGRLTRLREEQGTWQERAFIEWNMTSLLLRGEGLRSTVNDHRKRMGAVASIHVYLENPSPRVSCCASPSRIVAARSWYEESCNMYRIPPSWQESTHRSLSSRVRHLVAYHSKYGKERLPYIMLKDVFTAQTTAKSVSISFGDVVAASLLTKLFANFRRRNLQTILLNKRRGKRRLSCYPPQHGR